ncbi:hypothetical protein [Limisalsivibrio acetivorans]|uniref:hypothetical protein n=1 Tax=Limisalsivibrio acetivorans TaxID=1304888 RepID=UPI0003B3DAAB|nr:hypothetical protein [Limisalsivibrio acetivorans]
MLANAYQSALMRPQPNNVPQHANKGGNSENVHNSAPKSLRDAITAFAEKLFEEGPGAVDSWNGQTASSVSVQMNEYSYQSFNEQTGEHVSISQTSISITIEFGDEAQSAEETPDEAEGTGGIYDEMFGKDGYWGAEKTSDRLLDFAEAISGGDPSRLEAARRGVLKGFEAAERDLGELPEVAHDTLELTLEKLDALIEELRGTEEKALDLTA